MIYLLLTLILTFVYTHALIYLSYSYAKQNLMQSPHARGTHQKAIPRGVGLAIVMVCLIALLSLFLTQANFPSGLALVLIIGGAMIAAVGFWDDHGHVSPIIRLAVQSCAVALALQQMDGFPLFYVLDYGFYVGWVGHIFAFFGMIWFINLYNFIDGLDGLAGTQTLFVSTSLMLLFYFIGLLSLSWFMLVLAVSMSAFLCWNWQPAKIFMGDVCSCFLGFLFAVFMAYTARDNVIPLIAWLILLALPIVDMSYTLIVRLLKGYSYQDAHCSHAYQHAVKRFGSHQAVVLRVLAINLFWLAPWAFAAFLWSNYDLLFFMIAVPPIFYLVIKLGAGQENDFSKLSMAPRDRFELPTK